MHDVHLTRAGVFDRPAGGGGAEEGLLLQAPAVGTALDQDVFSARQEDQGERVVQESRLNGLVMYDDSTIRGRSVGWSSANQRLHQHVSRNFLSAVLNSYVHLHMNDMYHNKNADEQGRPVLA